MAIEVFLYLVLQIFVQRLIALGVEVGDFELGIYPKILGVSRDVIFDNVALFLAVFGGGLACPPLLQ